MRQRSRYLVALLCCTLAWGVLPQYSFALVYKGYPGTGHTTAPYGLSAWDNIGEMTLGAGIYLGDGWVLTPYHVYQHTHPEGGDSLSYLDLDQRYHEISGTAERIEYSPGVDADLIMFRINGNPDLELINISRNAPLDKEVTIIAAGRTRLNRSNENWGEVTWPGGYAGFETESERAKRWGENETRNYTHVLLQDLRWGQTNTLITDFNASGAAAEAQPVDRDSGGGLFVEKGNSWELAGVVLAIGTPTVYSGPDARFNAVYNNGAFYGNLAAYRSRIEDIRLIPLPGDADWDGDVDMMDYNHFLAQFGGPAPGGPTDPDADFNDDGMVDMADFKQLHANFGMVSGNGIHGGSGAPLMAPVPVPEPVTLLVLAAGVPLLLRSPVRRRRT